MKINKDYVFDGPDGEVTLDDLFQGRNQLVVQHFMFAPDWNEGLQALLVLGRRLRALDPASCRARHRAGRDLARPAAKARRVQAANGLDVRLVLIGEQRLQS